LTEAERIAALELENAKLRQAITAAAMWCPDRLCEVRRLANACPGTMDECLTIFEEICKG
jgi:hypothetical protein